MSHFKKIFSAMFCLALMLSGFISLEHPAAAQSAHATVSNQPPYVTARLIADTTAIQPGKPFKLGVELTMKSGWHTYYKESGDAGLPTKITWHLPPGFTAGPVLWEKPEKFNDSGIVTYGYKDKTLLATTINSPATLAGDKVELTADVKWLSCAEICVPGGTKLLTALPIDKTGVVAKPDNTQEFSKVGFEGSVKNLGSSEQPRGPDSASVLNRKFELEGSAEKPQSLLAYLGLALVGGLILNVMPCVLPVIAIKVLSLFEQARDEPRRVRLLGLTFAAGIICSFLVLAAIVIAIQATGRTVGWGFQFQYPGFVIAMSSLVLLFALSLFGLFYVSVPGQSKVDALANKEGMTGTFFKGVLATVLSTPCTAPFLGTALGFAFAQPWWTVLLIFFAIGLGMSSPYLVLTAKPDWLQFMPKPGVWMEKFKESLGFILLATVAWLLSVLGSQLGIEGMTSCLYFFIALSFATWLVSRFTDLTSSQSRKLIVYAIACAVVGISFYCFIWRLPGIGVAPRAVPKSANASALQWQAFSPEALDKLLVEHKTVLLDFTADWCLTCKFNEQTVLESQSVVDKIKALNVVTMRADWTVQDPTITKLLNQFNRSGVPLYVIFPGKRPNQPIVLPEVINQQLMLEKLEQAGPSS